MKISYINDIHLEFGKLEENPSGKDILILAGDVNVNNEVKWINKIAKQFEYVIYVIGNHECYYQNIKNVYSNIKKLLVDNVYLLQNESVRLNGVNFHGTTLWTDFEKGNPLSYRACEVNINDFYYISTINNNIKAVFSTKNAHTEHNIAKVFLYENVKKGDVVVTHHAPTFKSIGKEHIGSKFNGGFASDLSDLIIEVEPILWFHGHCHDTSDYMVHNTRVLCNPRGYFGHEENYNFDVQKTIDI